MRFFTICLSVSLLLAIASQAEAVGAKPTAVSPIKGIGKSQKVVPMPSVGLGAAYSTDLGSFALTRRTIGKKRYSWAGGHGTYLLDGKKVAKILGVRLKKGEDVMFLRYQNDPKGMPNLRGIKTHYLEAWTAIDDYFHSKGDSLRYSSGVIALVKTADAIRARNRALSGKTVNVRGAKYLGVFGWDVGSPRAKSVLVPLNGKAIKANF